MDTVLNALKADAELNSLAGGRIYRVRMPDSIQYPAILYRISEEPASTLNGGLSKLKSAYSFELYGKSFVVLEAISDRLTALITTAPIYGVMTDKADDDYSTEQGIFSIILEFSIWQ